MGAWLSCEEIDRGYIHECDVTRNAPTRRPALGRFKHEAAAVDGPRRTVYLTEDESDGYLYRFRHATAGDLSAGTLEVASVAGPDGGAVTWLPVPDPSAGSTPTRNQVAGAARFRGGEGAWYRHDVLHFTTKGDNRVWRYDVVTSTLTIAYDAATSCNRVRRASTTSRCRAPATSSWPRTAATCRSWCSAPTDRSPVVEVNGHDDSEITGPAFSPDGSRLYFSSQRYNGVGITYEVRGPFR